MRNISENYTKSIPVSQMVGTVAVWTQSYAGDLIQTICDTTDEVCQIIVPLEAVKLNDSGEMPTEAKISTLEMSYTIAAAALDAAVTAEIQSVAKAVDGAAPVVTTIACTVSDTVLSDTTTVDDHLIVITPDTNAIMTGDAEYILEVNFDKAASSTVAITGCKMNAKNMIAQKGR